MDIYFNTILCFDEQFKILPVRDHTPSRSGQTRGPPESPEQGEIPPASEPAQIISGQICFS